MDVLKVHQRLRSVAWLAAGLMACGAAQAADAAAQSVDPLRLQYEREKADCLTGKSGQPRNVCLREASSAYAQARKGQLVTQGNKPEQLAANALKRCQAQPADDRELCERRVREGQSEGSVKGGGQIKSLTVRSTDIPKTPG